MPGSPDRGVGPGDDDDDEDEEDTMTESTATVTATLTARAKAMIEACRRGDEAAAARCALADYYTEHLPHRTLDIWQLKLADFPIVFKDKMPRSAHDCTMHDLLDPDGLPVVAPDMRVKSWDMTGSNPRRRRGSASVVFVSRRRWGPKRDWRPVQQCEVEWETWSEEDEEDYGPGYDWRGISWIWYFWREMCRGQLTRIQKIHIHDEPLPGYEALSADDKLKFFERGVFVMEWLLDRSLRHRLGLEDVTWETWLGHDDT
jgi:hypothetical protein